MSRLIRFLFFALVSVPPLATALESDRQQPIHVRADRMEVDNRKGMSSYRGNVTLEQGSLYMSADLLVVYRATQGLDRIEAEGRPVRFRQRPDGAAADVEGEAQRLEYHAAGDRLLLQGGASVRQGGDRFSGERIEYDTMLSRVQASGQDNGDGRVHAIIQPRSEGEKTP
jgi:lipopolysaccharide export system protein LptA